MTQELTCPLHGPYPASYGNCPRCAKMTGVRPQDPGPIGASEDDMPTDYFGGRERISGPQNNMDESQQSFLVVPAEFWTWTNKKRTLVFIDTVMTSQN